MESTVRVFVDPTVTGPVPNAVAYETNGSRDQACDPNLFVYDHHGEEFGQSDPGALTSLYEDLALGRSLPPAFVTREVRDVDTLFAASLFMQRDLVRHPAMAGLVGSVDLVHRRGSSMLAHIDSDLGKLLVFLRATFPAGLSNREAGDRVGSAVAWIRDFVVDGRLPHPGKGTAPVRELTRDAARGFVLGECAGDLLGGWIDLYREGALCGVLVSPERHGRRRVLMARKSVYVPVNLSVLARTLNEMERVTGEIPEWGTDGTWLWGPSEGSVILVSHLAEVFLRVLG